MWKHRLKVIKVFKYIQLLFTCLLLENFSYAYQVYVRSKREIVWSSLFIVVRGLHGHGARSSLDQVPSDWVIECCSKYN